MKKLLYLALLLSVVISCFASGAGAYTQNGVIYEDCGDHCEVSGCSPSLSGAVTIPPSVSFGGKALPVTVICAFAFENNGTITKIVMPDSVTRINDSAFSCCTSLKTVTFSKSLTDVGEDAFLGCSALTSASLPDGVKNVGKRAFAQCGSLTSAVIPEGVSLLCDGTFADCAALLSVKLPSTLRTVGAYAFSGCAKLKSLIVPDGVIYVKDSAFRGCAALESAVLPESLVSLGDSVFYGCDGLNTVYYKGTAESWERLFSKKAGLSDGVSLICDYSGAVKGDCNGDGEINNKDIVVLFRYVSLGVSAVNNEAFDFNADGVTDNKDVVALFRYVSSTNKKEI